MKGRRYAGIMILALTFGGTGMSSAESSSSSLTMSSPEGLAQAVVQIGGRFCEYHREDVEGALRRNS